MAVAVKNTPETTPKPLNRFAVGSFGGMVFVLGSFWILFFFLPHLWWNVLEFSSDSFLYVSLLLTAMLAAGAGLVYLGRKLAGPTPPHGLRAGVFIGIVLLLFDFFVVQALGMKLEEWGTGMVGMAITLGVAAVLLFFSFRPFFRASFEKSMIRFEDQGWFSTAPYKQSQGMRVRRGTILGLLAVAACGIYTLLIRQALAGDWTVPIPFVDDGFITLLPARRYTLTLLLALGALWFSWRVVNYPTFADFLIATEAEINKVSWTTRKRLVQDTIVVLTTVILMTFFLLIVDVLWFKILSHPRIQILRIDTTNQAGTEAERQEW